MLSSGRSLSQWLDWLETSRPEHEMDFGLERIQRVGEKLGLLKLAPLVITVGGTNGKGSTIAVLESILLAAGYKVGVFTSPHFIAFNERIKVNGQPVSDVSLCTAFEAIEEGRGNTWLTYFEFATLAACACFQEEGVDIALMEVGLGGRLDATNAVDPDIAAITTVSLDHQEYLGYTMEAIAREKAGIMRAGKPVVYGGEPAPSSLVNYAQKLGAKLCLKGREFAVKDDGVGWKWSGVDIEGRPVMLDYLPFPSVVLDNAATALQVVQFLPVKVEREAVIEGLKNAALTGRFQVLNAKNGRHQSIDVVLDVAHNPQAAEKLAERLTRSPCSGSTRVVLAMCSDKDTHSVIDELKPVVLEWYVSQFESPRALSGEALLKNLEAHEQKGSGFADVQQALDNALDASEPGDRVVVTGSFMTVAAALTHIREG